MSLFVFGLSHKTADLSLREKIAVAEAELGEVVARLHSASGAKELALLSTCNRTEFHGVADSIDPVLQHIRRWCEQRLGLSDDVAANSPFYCVRETDAVHHMIRVGSGMDSMVLGEPQIFGQMKRAYAQAVESSTVQHELHQVFAHVFTVSKKIRSSTGIGANPVSVASAAVRLSRHVFSELRSSSALLIGAGETIALAARHLHAENVGEIRIANRTMSHGEALAEEVGAQAIALSSIPQALQSSDIVITSTASQLPVIGKGMVEHALKQRKNKPIFMVDIAVPRDVEQQVGELDNVYLYTIDDLQDIVESNMREREAQVAKADEIIREATQDFLANAALRAGADRVRAYRRHAEQMREQELAKALAALRSGREPEQVLNSLASGLTNKLIHAPSVALKQASADDDHDKLQWAEQVLGLPASDRDAIDADNSRKQGNK